MPGSLTTPRHDGRPLPAAPAGRARLLRSTNRQRAGLPPVKAGAGTAGQGRPAGAVRPPGGGGAGGKRHRNVSAQLRAAGAKAGR
jgi:hypothetical protein